MIRAAVFDLGDVVCAFDSQRRLGELATQTGLPPERIHEAIWTSGLDTRAESGQQLAVDLDEHQGRAG